MFNKPYVKVQNTRRNVRVKTPAVKGIQNKGITKQNPPVRNNPKDK